MHRIHGGTPSGRPLRYHIQAMGITQSQVTKNTRPAVLCVGADLIKAARCEISSHPIRVSWRSFTSHEPRPFPLAEGYSRRCRQFEFIAAQRHLTPRRPANCELRPAGPSGPYSIFSFQQRKISTARAANQMLRARTLMMQYQPDFPRSW